VNFDIALSEQGKAQCQNLLPGRKELGCDWNPQNGRMGIVVTKLEMMWTKLKEILYILAFLCEVERGERTGFSAHYLLNMSQLIHIHMSIMCGVNVSVRFKSRDVGNHDGQGGVLDNVGRYPDGEVSRTLVHTEIQFTIDDGDLNPAMTRCHNHLSLKPFMLQAVLGNPRADDVRFQTGIPPDLFNQVFKLIEPSTLKGREVVESLAI